MIKSIFAAGALAASLCVSAGAQTTAPTPASPATIPATGTWKVAGNVQGVSVILSCALVEADHKLTGACVDMDNKSHAVSGAVKDQMVMWSFNTEYEGSPITVNLMGTRDTTGTKLAGTISVDPMAVDGDFSATLEPAASAPAAS